MKTVEQVGRLIYEYLNDKYILEIACGSAEFSLMASSIANKIECIDLDDFRLLPEIHLTTNVSFQKMDATKLLFPDESFDTVVTYNAIGHLSSIFEEILNECFRVLRKGGVLCIITSWSLDKTIISDKVVPLFSARNLEYITISKGKTICLEVRN